MSHKKITSISYKGLCVILKSFRCACTLILINACTHTLALRALTRVTSWISKGIFVCLVQMSHWAQGVQPRLFVCLDRPTSQASKPLKAPLGLALEKRKILSFLPGSAVAGSDALVASFCLPWKPPRRCQPRHWVHAGSSSARRLPLPLRRLPLPFRRLSSDLRPQAGSFSSRKTNMAGCTTTCWITRCSLTKHNRTHNFG